MELTEDVLRSFHMGRVFKPKAGGVDARVNSLAFHSNRDLLVTASNNDEINLYDTNAGEHQRTFYSKKYGVANVSFTHDPNSIIYSSTKVDNAWRYHDLHKNEYVRFFHGHIGRVTTLTQSPLTDLVLSSGEDRQVRLWDLRSGICQAMLEAPGLPTAAWDEQGCIFCIGTESGVIKLYDPKNYSAGPFTTFTIPNECDSNQGFSCLRFSLDGKYLLGVIQGRIYVLDAFTGELVRTISTEAPDGCPPMEACLTADGKYILSGCFDRHIRAWNVETGQVVASWEQHADIPTCLKMSRRKMVVASACQALALWIPEVGLPSVIHQGQPV